MPILLLDIGSSVDLWILALYFTVEKKRGKTGFSCRQLTTGTNVVSVFAVLCITYRSLVASSLPQSM